MTTTTDDDEYTPRCPTCGGRMKLRKRFRGWYWLCPGVWCRLRTTGGHSGY